jgi:hypothetical protein
VLREQLVRVRRADVINLHTERCWEVTLLSEKSTSHGRFDSYTLHQVLVNVIVKVVDKLMKACYNGSLDSKKFL